MTKPGNRPIHIRAIYGLKKGKKTRGLPKHMPQSPVRTVSRVIQPRSPSQVSLKIRKQTIRTITVCPNITMNCVITWPKRISVPVRPEEICRAFIFRRLCNQTGQFLRSHRECWGTYFFLCCLLLYTPDTRLLSSRPSFLSSNMAPDVKATERKKMTLRKY